MLLAVLWVKFKFSDLQLQESVAREKSIRGRKFNTRIKRNREKIKIKKQRKRR